MKKLIVRNSDDIFAPPDPLSSPLDTVIDTGRLTCVDCITELPIFWLRVGFEERGASTGDQREEEQEVGVLTPSALSLQNLYRLADPSPKATASFREPRTHN